MPLPNRRALDEFPFPIAHAYSLIFDNGATFESRCRAACFTQYQLFRLLGLTLVSQYLREESSAPTDHAAKALNGAIKRLRCPHFSEWLTLVNTFRNEKANLGYPIALPEIEEALENLNDRRRYPLSRVPELPQDAILGLRNHLAHSGMIGETDAEGYFYLYLPVLERVLQAFEFMGDCRLILWNGDDQARSNAYGPVRVMRGHQPGEAINQKISTKLLHALDPETEPVSVIETRLGEFIPLLPFVTPLDEREPIYLYDGHYGMQMHARQGLEERASIYYLGTGARRPDSAACDQLRQLLHRRTLEFFLEKDQTAPWTIVDAALDYTATTLEDLMSTRKYLPSCYLPEADLEEHFDRFLEVPDRKTWNTDTTRKQHINGLVVTGFAGAGKTAFLARQVERLLAENEAKTREIAKPEPRNLVLFLRGDGIALRGAQGVSLFRDMCERLGIAIEGAGFAVRKGGGFSKPEELLKFLHQQWLKDRRADRRLVLVLDALNEAPLPEEAVKQAFEFIGEAARYPWLKIIVSVRQEWLTLWANKMDATEGNPLQYALPFLYSAKTNQAARPQDMPSMNVPALSPDRAGEVYERYRTAAPHSACTSSWLQLSANLRQLLTNPLHLHLFMDAFAGKPAATVEGVPDLFRRYVQNVFLVHPGMKQPVRAVIGYLLRNLDERQSASLDDDDSNTIRDMWTEGRSKAEIRFDLNPVEALCQEGFLSKRVREEGGGYRFVFQKVSEYLIYNYLAEEKPKDEDELEYWTRQASHPVVFFEYSASFAFLFRQWAQDGKLEWIGPLVETGGRWLTRILFEFLWEQALTATRVAEASPAAITLAEALRKSGGIQCGLALQSAADHLTPTQYLHAAVAYYPAAIELLRNVGPFAEFKNEADHSLAWTSFRYGCLLSDFGDRENAQANLERCVVIAERLWQQDPSNHIIGGVLASGLRSRGLLWSSLGLIDDAGMAFERAVQVAEDVHEANRSHEGLAQALGFALLSHGGFCQGRGRWLEAADLYERALALGDDLVRANPKSVAGAELSASAHEAAASLHYAKGDIAAAEKEYRRAHQSFYERWLPNQGNIDLGFSVISCLQSISNMMQEAGRLKDAEQSLRNSVGFLHDWRVKKPESLRIGIGLANAQASLAFLLTNSAKLAEAETLYAEAAAAIEKIYTEHPDNATVGLTLARVHSNFGFTLQRAAKIAASKSEYLRAKAILVELRPAMPEHREVNTLLVYATMGIGAVEHTLGDMAAAEIAYREAVAEAERFAPAGPSTTAGSESRIYTDALESLTSWFWAVGRLDEAIAESKKLVEVRRKTSGNVTGSIEVDLGFARALKKHGSLRQTVGDFAAAIQVYQEALELLLQLQKRAPNHVRVGIELSDAHLLLGDIFFVDSKIADAEYHYEASYQIAEPLWKANPHYLELAKQAAGAYHGWGLTQLDRFKPSSAEWALRQALTLREEILRQNPHDLDSYLGLGRVLGGLGLILFENHNLGEAEKLYRRAIDIFRDAIRSSPLMQHARDQLGVNAMNLSYLLPDVGKFVEAEAFYRETIAIYESLLGDEPNNQYYAVTYGLAWNNIGILKSTLGRLDAEEPLNCGLRKTEEIHRVHPEQRDGLNGLLWSLSETGLFYQRTGRRREADEMWHRAIQISEPLWRANPKDPRACINLGRVLVYALEAAGETGDWHRAERHFELGRQVYLGLLELNGDDPEGRRGAALLAAEWASLAIRIGDLNDADARIKMAVEFGEYLVGKDPVNCRQRFILAKALAIRGEWHWAAERAAEAIADLRLAIAEFEKIAEICQNYIEQASWYGRTCASQAAITVQIDPAESRSLFARSLEVLRKTCERAPGFVAPRRELVRALNLIADHTAVPASKEAFFAEARAIAGELIRIDPDNTVVAILNAWSEIGLGLFENAEIEIGEVLAELPRHTLANCLWARLQAQKLEPKKRWYQWWK